MMSDRTLGTVGARALTTNLVLHHGITNIFDNAAELFHILSAVEESCDLPSLCQRQKVIEDDIQFAVK